MKKILGGLGVYQKCWSFNRNRLKFPENLKRVVMGRADSQHKQIFVKYLCRVSPQSLQTFQLTAGLEFGCSILLIYDQMIVKFVLSNFRVNCRVKVLIKTFIFFEKYLKSNSRRLLFSYNCVLLENSSGSYVADSITDLLTF